MPAPVSPQETFQIMIGNILKKTGKDFASWVRLAQDSEITKFKALTDYMKSSYGLTHGYAQLVAWGVLDPERLHVGLREPKFVEELYTGKKAHLRPIYERLISEGLKMGEDIELIICKTYSSLRSRSQFAIIAPRTNSYVDLELVLPEEYSGHEGLTPFKTSNPKFRHRIRIGAVEQIDEEVLSILRTAWEFNRG